MYFSVEKRYEWRAMMYAMGKHKLSLEERFEAMELRMQSRFDAIDQKFELLREESHRHMVALMEDNRHYIGVLVEGNNARFERIERHVGLEQWTG